MKKNTLFCVQKRELRTWIIEVIKDLKKVVKTHERRMYLEVKLKKLDDAVDRQ